MNSELLIKLSPLLVATLHGYGAAWLAVRMLFRPRQPRYLLGRQLPLTPGLLPKERTRFIAALSTSIAEKLLNIEVLANELLQLDLETELQLLAEREFMAHAKSETVLRALTGYLRERLLALSHSEEDKLHIVRQLRAVIERETRDAGFLRRWVADRFFDEATLHGVVGRALEAWANDIAASDELRRVLSETLTALPRELLKEQLVSANAVTSLVETLSRKLDVRAILWQRLSNFSNEEIEALVMETAGREIKAIVWFGAAIGLVVGIAQTLLNFI